MPPLLRLSLVRSTRSASLLLAGAAWLPAAALAQQGAVPQVNQPVVQQVPGEHGMRLNSALNRLARNPQDVEALIDAGKASLDLGDAQAAVGFFQRAGALAPSNAQVKAGLAGAYVLSEDPFTAIPLFEEAARAGPIEPDRLADRGLAYDLVGDNATAQTYYRQALAAGPNEETLRRLALSLAIAGDRKGMDTTLSPLLQVQNKAAWRTRAFGFAILGNADEAEAIARQTMPADMAGSITAYLRYMPKLTPSQQAAAANLGHFPRAAEIGRDDPRIAQYARPRVVLAKAEPVPAPRSEPAGRGGRTGQPPRARETVKPKPAPPALPPAAPPEPKVGRQVEGQPVQLAVAPPPPPAPSPQPAPVPPPVEPASPPSSAPQPGPGPGSLDPAGVGGFNLRSTTQAQQGAPDPAPAPPPPKPRPSLDEAFAEFTPPSREAVAPAGAVDIRKLKPLPAAAAAAKGKPDPAKDAKPVKPSHPSRIWVQVATGRDKRALGFDWNRMVKADAAVFKGKKGHISAWGQTNRLLAGPFESEAAARAFVAQLKKAGVDGAFLWTSPAGQIVDVLAGAR
jgi:Flp pilus assembly protein TadD